MLHLGQLAAVIGAAIAVAGCVSGDPGTDGFFGGVHGLTTGAYQRRVETQAAVLAGTNRLLVTEQERQAALREREEEQLGRTAELRGRLAELDRDSAILRNEMRRLSAERRDRRSELARTAARAEAVERDVAALRRQSNSIDAIHLQERERALRIELDQLWKVYHAIEQER